MRIVLLTWGTRGDVQPLAALASRLAAGGSEVLFGAPPAFAELARARGLAFAPVGRAVDPVEYGGLIDRMTAEPNPRKQNRFLVQNVLLPDLERLHADSLDAVRGADLVVSHWLQVGGALAAEQLGLPWASVTLHPGGVESAGLDVAGRDGEAGEALSAWLWGEGVHRFRTRLGLPAVRSVAAALYSRSLNVVAASPLLLPDAHAWPPQHVPVGFFHLNPPEGWRPPAELERFLERHGPPVVVTFSSIAGKRIDGSGDVLREALEELGRPAILQSGWSGLGALRGSERLLCVGDVPHAWLLPRAACVVHHGGAGTTAAALRAGVPSVVVWHVFDQPYWGNLLADRGLGPRPLSRVRLEARALAERADEALSTPAYGQRCRALAERLAAEDGVGRAAELLCRMVGWAGNAPPHRAPAGE